MSNMDPIAVVTGASRGAGAGIARALGSHGYAVYVTGRSEKSGDSALPGTIQETAEQVTALGGKGIAVRVDHADDEQVKDFFERVGRESGKIDVLVNNAAIIRDEMMGQTKFWEEPLNVVDTLEVGLRSSYVATVFAVPRERCIMRSVPHTVSQRRASTKWRRTWQWTSKTPASLLCRSGWARC